MFLIWKVHFAAKWLSSQEAIGMGVVCVQMLSLSALSQDHFQIKGNFRILAKKHLHAVCE